MILCCGEALIDMVPAANCTGRMLYEPICGGAVFNTALALGRLGAPAGLVTGVSTDPLGQKLADALQGSGVRTDLLVRNPRPTTLAMVHLAEGQAQYTFYDEGSAGRMVIEADLPEPPPETAALFCGGISLCALPVADALAGYAERYAHLPLMVDPNIRPGFIEEETAYRARLNRLLSVADIVKVSTEDLDWLFPDQSETDQRAALMAFDLAFACVTRGGDGAEAWLSGGETLTVASTPVQVQDTIGAGDTFNAGLLTALWESGKLSKSGLWTLDHAIIETAMTLATRAAAVTVSRAGADAPWRADVEIV